MLVLKKHLHLLFRGSKAAVDVDHRWYDGGGQELDKNEMACFFFFSPSCLFFHHFALSLFSTCGSKTNEWLGWE